MNPPSEKTDPPSRRGFFTRKRLILLLVLGLATAFVLLIPYQEDRKPRASSPSLWETLRTPSKWAENFKLFFLIRRYLADERKQIQRQITELGPEHPKVLEDRERYASALLWNNQNAKGEAELRSILQVRERVFGPDHGSIQKIRSKLAHIYVEKRQYDQAEVMYRAMLRTRERAERTDSKETLDILYDLACCLIKQNKRKEAIPYAKRAVLGYQQVIGIHESRTKDAEKMLEDLQPKK